MAGWHQTPTIVAKPNSRNDYTGAYYTKCIPIKLSGPYKIIHVVYTV